jgi:hypothetical protein
LSGISSLKRDDDYFVIRGFSRFTNAP